LNEIEATICLVPAGKKGSGSCATSDRATGASRNCAGLLAPLLRQPGTTADAPAAALPGPEPAA
jgi:hypothetical protein